MTLRGMEEMETKEMEMRNEKWDMGYEYIGMDISSTKTEWETTLCIRIRIRYLPTYTHPCRLRQSPF